MRVAATERIHTTGGLNNTGGELDIAINGRGFLQGAAGRHPGLHPRRRAAAQPERQLTTVSGYVIQPPMNVPDNALSISIGNDGIVTVTQPGAAGINVQIGQLQIATFINPTGLQSVGENLYLKPTPPARPTCCSRAWTAPARSCTSTWKPPTSTWPKSW